MVSSRRSERDLLATIATFYLMQRKSTSGTVKFIHWYSISYEDGKHGSHRQYLTNLMYAWQTAKGPSSLKYRFLSVKTSYSGSPKFHSNNDLYPRLISTRECDSLPIVKQRWIDRKTKRWRNCNKTPEQSAASVATFFKKMYLDTPDLHDWFRCNVDSVTAASSEWI